MITLNAIHVAWLPRAGDEIKRDLTQSQTSSAASTPAFRSVRWMSIKLTAGRLGFVEPQVRVTRAASETLNDRK